jgi:hypothetical protein
MPLYAIARIHVVEAANAREAFEGFDENVRRDPDGSARVEYQTNCFPITPEQADEADWHIEDLRYANRTLESIPAYEEEER